jgi:hypothetical protein
MGDKAEAITSRKDEAMVIDLHQPRRQSWTGELNGGADGVSRDGTRTNL